MLTTAGIDGIDLHGDERTAGAGRAPAVHPHELAQLQRNALRVAKLAAAQWQAIMAEIESRLTRMG